MLREWPERGMERARSCGRGARHRLCAVGEVVSGRLPAASEAERHAAAEHQHGGLGPTFPVHRNPRSAGLGPAPHGGAPTTPAAVSADVEEVALLLQAARGPNYRAAFATAYGAGLHVSEVVALKVGHIAPGRMLLRIERGRGGKDRHAMLSPQLLEVLRAWWREGRRLGALLPGGWLFPGRNPVEPL